MIIRKVPRYLAMSVLLAAAPQALSVELGIDGLTVDGRVRQGYSVLYDLDDGGTEEGPSNYLGEIKAGYRPDRNFTYIGNFWIRGMWNDPDWVEPEGGLKDLTHV